MRPKNAQCDPVWEQTWDQQIGGPVKAASSLVNTVSTIVISAVTSKEARDKVH